jgi:predicted DNA-binding transcriptional regulator AlpA
VVTPDRFMTLEEIAAELRVSYGTAWRAARDGRLQGAVQIGGPHSAWRVDKSGYRAFLEKSSKSGNAADNAAEGNADLAGKHG